MSPSHEILKTAIKADVPVLLWGQPGTGKTAVIKKMALTEGAHLETLIGSTLDPVDVCGMPVPHEGRVKLAPPAWAERIKIKIESGKRAWLFLDELSCAPPSVHAAFLRIVNDRQVGELNLSGMRVIAASNRADMAADGGFLSGAMANRWAHADWTISADEWCAGQLSGWGKNLEAQEIVHAAGVCAFVRRKPDILLSPPKQTEDAGGAWPSPRSWSAAIALLSHSTKENFEALAASVVGNGAAREYAEFFLTLSLPDPEDVLSGRAVLPTRGDQMTAALGSLVSSALLPRPDREKRVKTAWHILGNIRPDQALASAKTLLLGAPENVQPETIALGKKILGVKKYGDD